MNLLTFILLYDVALVSGAVYLAVHDHPWFALLLVLFIGTPNGV